MAVLALTCVVMCMLNGVCASVNVLKHIYESIATCVHDMYTHKDHMRVHALVDFMHVLVRIRS